MIQKIVDHLLASHFDAELTDSGEIRVRHIIGDIPCSILAHLPKHFPAALPKFSLENRADFGSLAHIGGSAGIICGDVEENLSLNFDCPELVFKEALDRILSQLKRTLLDHEWNRQEIMREYAAEWTWGSENTNGAQLVCMTEIPTGLMELTIKASDPKIHLGLNAYYIACTQTESELNTSNVFSRSFNHKHRSVEGKGCIIPLSPLPMPPTPGEDLSDWWGSALDGLPHSQKQELKQFAKRHRSTVFWVVITGNTPSGTTWCAFRGIYRKKAPAPLTSEYLVGWEFQVHPISVINKETILPRSGGDLDLQDKTVGIVGCGSVGSIIAEQLSQSGVRQLELFDPDIYTPENIHRHALPAQWVFTPKSIALAEQLQADYPYCHASYHSQTELLDLLETDIIDKLDLVIVATGNPTIERLFDRQLRGSGKTIPALYSWVESHGVGGHAVLSLPLKQGCLACAYISNIDDTPGLNSNLDFLAPNQLFTRNHAGCGSLFLPYSGVDASQTAIMTVRLAIEALRGEIETSIARSWKGNSKTAEQEELRLTHRFLRSNDTWIEQSLYREACNVCNG